MASNQILDIIEDLKEKISDNEYLSLMNLLKDKNKEEKKENSSMYKIKIFFDTYSLENGYRPNDQSINGEPKENVTSIVCSSKIIQKETSLKECECYYCSEVDDAEPDSCYYAKVYEGSGEILEFDYDDLEDLLDIIDFDYSLCDFNINDNRFYIPYSVSSHTFTSPIRIEKSEFIVISEKIINQNPLHEN